MLASKPATVTMPMLTDTAASKSSKAMGRSTTSRIRAARVAASSTPLRPSHTTTNSSPPVRAMVSDSRSACLKRRAISIKTRSPPSCPTLSFTILNASRSQNITAVTSFALAVRASAIARRSMRSNRFGSPVSVSCRASSMSSPSAAFRSVMSRALVTIPRTDGLSRQFVSIVSNQRQTPLWLRSRISAGGCATLVSRSRAIRPSRVARSTGWMRSRSLVPSRSSGR